MTNKQVKSTSFYGNSAEKRCARKYLSPLERKALREKQEQINIAKNKPNNNLKTGIMSSEHLSLKTCNVKVTERKSFSFACSTSTKENDKHSLSSNKIGTKMKSCSPTINWAPSSLRKRQLKTMTDWKQVKLPKTTVINVDINTSGKTDVKNVENGETATLEEVSFTETFNRQIKENIKPPGGIRLNKDKNLPNLSQKKDVLPVGMNVPTKVGNKCVKELCYEESIEMGGMSNLPNVKQPDSNMSVTKTSSPKLFPIFSPKYSPKQSSPLLRSQVLKSASKTCSISPKHMISRISPSGSPRIQQTIIDAGQKQFGASQCNICGMVYTVNHPHDQQQHAIYHKRFLSTLKFTGWKRERVVATYMDGRILKVLTTDPKYVSKKIEEIRTVIDGDLGFSQNRSASCALVKVIYLYISDESQVVGCLIVEPITQAYRLLASSSSTAPVVSSALPAEKVACGVSRIWTYYPNRRCGIASRLMDALRKTFVLGSELDCDQIAFSDPTSDGMNFAASYCKTREFLTYNFNH